MSGNQATMAKMVGVLATPEIMSSFGHIRLAESFRIRCKPGLEVGSAGNELAEEMRRENGSGMLQTVSGEISRLIAGYVPPKLLQMLRGSPRQNWPLAMFTTQNLHKCGTNEGLMVKLQQANGVVNTKSTVVRLIENWETVNDLIEPLKRYGSIILIFDPIYGHVLQGILGVVTRELLYSKTAGHLKANEVNRLRIYVEIVRERFGGENMNASDVSKFFHYDSIVGAEAMHALEDLERLSAKEDKEDKDEKPDKPKICYEFNKASGCHYKRCLRIHKCLGCDEKGHPIGSCPEKRKAAAAVV